MSSLVSASGQRVSLHIIHIVTDTIIPWGGFILFLSFIVCVYVYTIFYNQPVPPSAILPVFLLFSSLLLLSLVGNLILYFAAPIPTRSQSRDLDLESGKIAAMADRLWYHLQDKFVAVREPNCLNTPIANGSRPVYGNPRSLDIQGSQELLGDSSLPVQAAQSSGRAGPSVARGSEYAPLERLPQTIRGPRPMPRPPAPRNNARRSTRSGPPAAMPGVVMQPMNGRGQQKQQQSELQMQHQAADRQELAPRSEYRYYQPTQPPQPTQVQPVQSRRHPLRLNPVRLAPQLLPVIPEGEEEHVVRTNFVRVYDIPYSSPTNIWPWLPHPHVYSHHDHSNHPSSQQQDLYSGKGNADLHDGKGNRCKFGAINDELISPAGTQESGSKTKELRFAHLENTNSVKWDDRNNDKHKIYNKLRQSMQAPSPIDYKTRVSILTEESNLDNVQAKVTPELVPDTSYPKDPGLVSDSSRPEEPVTPMTGVIKGRAFIRSGFGVANSVPRPRHARAKAHRAGQANTRDAESQKTVPDSLESTSITERKYRPRDPPDADEVSSLSSTDHDEEGDTNDDDGRHDGADSPNTVITIPDDEEDTRRDWI